MNRDMVEVQRAIEGLWARLRELEADYILIPKHYVPKSEIRDKIKELEADDQATAAQALADILTEG